MSLLTRYGVDNYVNGEKTKPVKFIKGIEILNPNFVLWTRINGVIKNSIYSSNFESMNYEISIRETTYDMWSCLELNFANTSRDRVMELKLQLQIFCKDSFSMSD